MAFPSPMMTPFGMLVEIVVANHFASVPKMLPDACSDISTFPSEGTLRAVTVPLNSPISSPSMDVHFGRVLLFRKKGVGLLPLPDFSCKVVLHVGFVFVHTYNFVKSCKLL